MLIAYIPLETNCVQEDPSVGGNVMNPLHCTIFSIIGYVWVFWDTFSLQWDMFIDVSFHFVEMFLFSFVNINHFSGSSACSLRLRGK